MLGASFAFYAVTPLAYDFFLGFQQFGASGEAMVDDPTAAAPLSVVFQGSAQEYLNLTIRFIVAFGMCFSTAGFADLDGQGRACVRSWPESRTQMGGSVGILTLAALVDTARCLIHPKSFMFVVWSKRLYESVRSGWSPSVEESAQPSACAAKGCWNEMKMKTSA